MFLSKQYVPAISSDAVSGQEMGNGAGRGTKKDNVQSTAVRSGQEECSVPPPLQELTVVTKMGNSSMPLIGKQAKRPHFMNLLSE